MSAKIHGQGSAILQFFTKDFDGELRIPCDFGGPKPRTMVGKIIAVLETSQGMYIKFKSDRVKSRSNTLPGRAVTILPLEAPSHIYSVKVQRRVEAAIGEEELEPVTEEQEEQEEQEDEAKGDES